MVEFYNSLEKEIGWFEASFLVDMLERTWNIEPTMRSFSRRAVSESPLFVANDRLTETDLAFLPGYFKLANGKVMPVGLVETLALNTDGIYENLPRSYSSLANKWWNRLNGDEDTLIFADVTTLETRRGTGLGNELMQYALEWLRENKSYRYLWAYTPNIEKVIRWHESLGAKNTGCVIRNARPKFKVRDVVVMEYSEKRKLYYTFYK